MDTKPFLRSIPTCNKFLCLINPASQNTFITPLLQSVKYLVIDTDNGHSPMQARIYS